MKKFRIRIRLPFYGLNISKSRLGYTLVWRSNIVGSGFFVTTI